MLNVIGYFLLDKWLWSVTWGWNQIILGLILMWMSLVFFGRKGSVAALILTISSFLFAFVVYSALIVGIFIYLFEWKFVALTEEYVVLNVLSASVWLGIIYSILQGIFFFILSKWYRLVLLRIFFITIFSNISSALLAAFIINVSA